MSPASWAALSSLTLRKRAPTNGPTWGWCLGWLFQCCKHWFSFDLAVESLASFSSNDGPDRYVLSASSASDWFFFSICPLPSLSRYQYGKLTSLKWYFFINTLSKHGCLLKFILLSWTYCIISFLLYHGPEGAKRSNHRGRLDLEQFLRSFLCAVYYFFHSPVAFLLNDCPNDCPGSELSWCTRYREFINNLFLHFSFKECFPMYLLINSAWYFSNSQALSESVSLISNLDSFAGGRSSSSLFSKVRLRWIYTKQSIFLNKTQMNDNSSIKSSIWMYLEEKEWKNEKMKKIHNGGILRPFFHISRLNPSRAIIS